MPQRKYQPTKPFQGTRPAGSNGSYAVQRWLDEDSMEDSSAFTLDSDYYWQPAAGERNEQDGADKGTAQRLETELRLRVL